MSEKLRKVLLTWLDNDPKCGTATAAVAFPFKFIPRSRAEKHSNKSAIIAHANLGYRTQPSMTKEALLTPRIQDGE